MFEERPQDVNPWIALLRRRLGITSANLWRRSAVEAVGGWNAEWESSQEAELMYRLLRADATVAVDPEYRTILHARVGSISNGFDADGRERYVRVRSIILEHCEEHGTLGADELRSAREAVFNSIRKLYERDPQAALDYYSRVLSPRYVPPVSGFNTRPYTTVMRLLGFRLTELVRKVATKR